MTTYTNLSGMSADGIVESSIQGILLGSMATMPTANANNLGCIVIYTGTTTASYTQNRFYKCVLDNGVYSWVLTEVSEEADLTNYVQKTTEINGHPLSSNITITSSDVGAVPTTREVNGQPLSADVSITLASLNGVPDTRTINSKALSSNISLDASDVGALATSVKTTTTPSSTSDDNTVPTSKAVYSYVNPINTALGNETTARASADNSLQGQIDALVAKSDVVDVVGTYSDLQNYDTSKLGNNDIVKVMSDSTHNDMTTYYRWVITAGVGAWSYIGGEGPYLTISSASSTYVPLTRTVNTKDLSSNISLDAGDVGAIPSSYLSTAKPVNTSTDTEVPTAKAVYTGLSEKMDAMTVDSAPTSGSQNLVTSGGVYTAIANVSLDITTYPSG